MSRFGREGGLNPLRRYFSVLVVFLRFSSRCELTGFPSDSHAHEFHVVLLFLFTFCPRTVLRVVRKYVSVMVYDPTPISPRSALSRRKGILRFRFLIIDVVMV